MRIKCTKCKEELEKKYVRQRGWIYLLYLLAVEVKENDFALSQTLDLSSRQAQIPFLPICKQIGKVIVWFDTA